MTAQVHMATSALHAFPTSPFTSQPSSAVATPSSERDMIFDSRANVSANGSADPKGKAPANRSSIPSSVASSQPMSPSTSQEQNSSSSSTCKSKRLSRSGRSTEGPSRAGGRPRLKSLQSLNAAPASPSLSGSTSTNEHIMKSPPTFSRQSSSKGGGAIESLQPLASGTLGRSESYRSRTSEDSISASFASFAFPEKPSSKSPQLDSDLSEFGAFSSSSKDPQSSPEGGWPVLRSQSQDAHVRGKPKRSSTIASGIESLSSVEPGPSRPKHVSSASLGFATALNFHTPREGPAVMSRRQTLSTAGVTSFDHLLSSQERTRSYSHHPGLGSGSSASPSATSSPQGQFRKPPKLQSSQLEAKVVILGTQGMGKTSLVHRYTTGQFSASSVPSTIGASFLAKKLVVDGVKVRLQLWDTAGQERFRSMAPMYYRGSNAAVIVYDITSMQSFLDVKSWIEELRRNMSTDPVIHVIGAKLDLAPSARAVDLDFARETIQRWVRPEVVTPSPSPKPSHTVSLSRGTSRLSGLGTLALGSASRLAAFPRGLSPPSGGTVKQGSAGGSASSAGSGGSDPGREGNSDIELPGSGLLSWDLIEVSEVSAKDNVGIDEAFLAVTKKLVERKALIESERLGRERDSIMLTDEGWNHGNGAGNATGIPNSSTWGCCT